MTALTLEDIKKSGGIASAKKERVKIHWEIGEKKFDGDIFVRDLPYRVTREFKDELDMFAACVSLGENGEEPLTRELVGQFKPEFIEAISVAVSDFRKKKT